MLRHRVLLSFEAEADGLDADRVVDELLAFREEVGDFGTLLYAGHDWTDKTLGRRSMELMATEVMPRVNKAIAGSAAVA